MVQWRWMMGLVALAGCTGSGTLGEPHTGETWSPPSDSGETNTGSALGDAPVSLGDLRLSDVQPTVPILSWTLDEAVDEVWIEFSFDEGEWHSSPARSGWEGEHEEYLFGVPEQHEVVARVRTSTGGQLDSSPREWSIINGSADELLPRPSEVFADEKLMHSDRWVLGSMNWRDGGWTQGDYLFFIMDRKGRIVWSRLTPNGHWSLYPRVARSGDHLILDESTYWSNGFNAEDGQLHRVTLDGTVWESIPVPGLHHSWDERTDGTLIWGSVLEWDDETLEYLTPEGDRGTLWSCQQWLQEIGESSWCESNTVNWDEKRDTVLFSFYTNDTVVEVQYPTGETLRQFGAVPGSYGFSPVASQFRWQHGVHWTDRDTILLSTHPSSGPNEQRAREYTVDDKGRMLEEVWSYGEGTGKFAPTAGEVYRLDNGNYLINYGGDAGIREITADGVVVWDVLYEGSKLIGHTSLIDDLYALNEGPDL